MPIEEAVTDLFPSFGVEVVSSSESCRISCLLDLLHQYLGLRPFELVVHNDARARVGQHAAASGTDAARASGHEG